LLAGAGYAGDEVVFPRADGVDVQEVDVDVGFVCSCVRDVGGVGRRCFGACRRSAFGGRGVLALLIKVATYSCF
jgi:hypothetical protein